jgi:hypothetical protein
MILYRFLDVFFLVFHTLLIFFNLVGWIYRPLRKANLIALLLTGGSWFILGIFYGIGFCPFTEWHWQVLERIGQRDLPVSYIAYLVHRFTGCLPDADRTDRLTLACYFIALGISVFLNTRDYRRKRLHQRNTKNLSHS